MKAFVKVEKNGITIPIDKLKGINPGAIVEIQIETVYVGPKDKKKLFSNKKAIYHVEASETRFIGRLRAQ
jgi:hypothetical protein